jgi:hypothetical protein
MIIWGWSTKEIGTKEASGNCASCSLPSLVIVGFQRVFDIFWIPVIPLGKSSCVSCQSCGATYVHEPSADETAIQNSGFKTPWWSFSGLIIIILMMIFGSISSASMQKEYNAFKDEPTSGAYFIFKSMDDDYKETPYRFGKIIGLEGDNVVLYLGEYAYSRSSGASKEVTKVKKSQDLSNLEVVEITREDFKDLDITSIL